MLEEMRPKQKLEMCSQGRKRETIVQWRETIPKLRKMIEEEITRPIVGGVSVLELKSRGRAECDKVKDIERL